MCCSRLTRLLAAPSSGSFIRSLRTARLDRLHGHRKLLSGGRNQVLSRGRDATKKHSSITRGQGWFPGGAVCSCLLAGDRSLFPAMSLKRAVELAGLGHLTRVSFPVAARGSLRDSAVVSP